MDYIAFGKSFFEATGIPVNLLLDGKPVYSSLGELLSFISDTTWEVYPPSRNPEFCSITPDLEYGRVKVEGTGYDFFIGPVFTTPVSETTMQELIQEQKIPPEYQEQLETLVRETPLFTHPQCLRYLMFLHQCLNQKAASIDGFYAEEDEETVVRTRQQVASAVESKEEEILHNAYAYELQLYHFISLGEVSRLKEFLEKTRTFPTEGRMARNPLRDVKNHFISFVSKVVTMAAIPGGMDEEKAYQLQDLYVLECEQLQTLDDVHRLQYIMLMDFCQRTGNARIPGNVSPEIHRCMTYIKNHTNIPLSIDDVAAQINRSRNYLMRHFKDEVGMQVNAYITQCKLEEACDLLTYGDTSLAEISTYLGFSSQSYFQNVFKKAYGVTPMHYRKLNGKYR